jgi:hypothetical protein
LLKSAFVAAIVQVHAPVDCHWINIFDKQQCVFIACQCIHHCALKIAVAQFQCVKLLVKVNQ